MRTLRASTYRLASSDFAPVTTILPEENTRAVVRGSRIRMTTAAKRLGLYSALRARMATDFRSIEMPKGQNIEGIIRNLNFEQLASKRSRHGFRLQTRPWPEPVSQQN